MLRMTKGGMVYLVLFFPLLLWLNSGIFWVEWQKKSGGLYKLGYQKRPWIWICIRGGNCTTKFSKYQKCAWCDLCWYCWLLTCKHLKGRFGAFCLFVSNHFSIKGAFKPPYIRPEAPKLFRAQRVIDKFSGMIPVGSQNTLVSQKSLVSQKYSGS